jgi:putative DNA primase/helicase
MPGKQLTLLAGRIKATSRKETSMQTYNHKPENVKQATDALIVRGGTLAVVGDPVHGGRKVANRLNRIRAACTSAVRRIFAGGSRGPAAPSPDHVPKRAQAAAVDSQVDQPRRDGASQSVLGTFVSNSAQDAKSILDVNVALYPNAMSPDRPTAVTLGYVLDDIRGDKYQRQITYVRDILKSEGKDAYKKAKVHLPAFCTSGTTPDRKRLAQHSNLLQLDFDDLGESVVPAKQKIISDAYVAAAFISPSGDGLKVIVHIDGARHQESVCAAREYFLRTYDLAHDPQVKEPTRLCFVSHDPDLYANPCANRIPLPTNKKQNAEPRADVHEWCKIFRGSIKTLNLPGLFKELGRLGKCLDSRVGKYSVKCPWSDQHGSKGVNWTQDDSSTVVVTNDSGSIFKCFHPACVERGIKDVVIALESESPGIVDRYCAQLRSEFSGEALSEKGIVSAWGETEADLETKLIARYGEAFQFKSNRNGDTEVEDFNPHYWTARFAVENLVIFDPKKRQFYTYNETTGTWCWQTEEAVRGIIAEWLLQYSRSLDIQLLDTLRTNTRLTFMLTLLRDVSERRDVFGKSDQVIHLANGMLHIDCDPPELREYSPHYYSLNQCPVAFNPNAGCPQFLSQLVYAAMNADDAHLLQLVFGLFLTGRNIWQKMLILTGIGGSGKGTMARIMEGIIGSRNIKQLRTKLLADRFELDNLDTASLLVGSDVAGDFLSSDGAKVIKALTGGDPLTVETKGGRKEDIYGNCNILITCNDTLRVKLDGDESAWRRRLLIIAFTSPAAKATPDFHKILLQQESEGILNWAILGAIHLAECARNSAPFPLTVAQQNRVDDLLGESDSLRTFVGTRVERAAGETLTVQELYSDYENFCAELGWYALSQKMMERSLGALMMEFHRASKRNDIKRGTTSKRGFAGVRIISQQSEDTI